MNIWFWPIAMGPASQHWQPGMGVTDAISRYLLFYVVTSLAWDVTRLVGNVVLILAFALPTLRALRRFQQRFAFTYQPDVRVVP